MPANTPTPAVAPLLWTMKETAEALRISERSVYSLAKSGKLRACRIGTRVLFSPGDVVRFIEDAKGAGVGDE